MISLVSWVQSKISIHLPTPSLVDPIEEYIENLLAHMSEVSKILLQIETRRNQGYQLEDLTDLIVQFDELVTKSEELDEPDEIDENHPAITRFELLCEEFACKHRKITEELAEYRDQCEDQAILAEEKKTSQLRV